MNLITDSTTVSQGEQKKNVELYKSVLKNVLKDWERIDFQEECKAIGIYPKNKGDAIKVTQAQMQHFITEKLINSIKEMNLGIYAFSEWIYIYNGTHWESVNETALGKFLGKINVRSGVVETLGLNNEFIKKLTVQLISRIVEEQPDVNLDVVKINLNNGTLTIDRGDASIQPFNKEDYIHYKLDFDYDPEATAPIWQAFLDEMLPEEEAQMILAEYIGYLFIRNGSDLLKIEKALGLIGDGGNGKSVVYEVLEALVGKDNCTTLSTSHIFNPNGRYVNMIENKILNYSSESGKNLSEELWKKVASGEPIIATPIYKAPYEVLSFAKLIFNLNKDIVTKDFSGGFYRRFLLLPFDKTPKNKDIHLSKKIRENELSGVLNFALGGLNRLLNNKEFTESALSESALDSFKEASNSVQSFINEGGYKTLLGQGIIFGDLFKDYVTYCTNSGRLPCSSIEFGKRLQNIVIERVQVRKFKGTGNVVMTNLTLFNVELEDYSEDSQVPF